jgi:serine/threonine protein phosphatase PrpC
MDLSSKEALDFFTQLHRRSGGSNGEHQEPMERKYSIGSETDKQLHRVNSFFSKTVSLKGEPFDAQKDGIGFACKKGLKPESPNQDSFFIMKVSKDFSLYGVFDGHGKMGHDVSNFVKDNLPKILLTQEMLYDNPEVALTNTFAKTQHLIEKATTLGKIDASRSGTTCSVVLHSTKDRKLYVAHVGDSRVVLGKVSPDHTPNGGVAYDALELTLDHKPDLPEERARIEKSGGVVLFDGGWNYRVYAKGKKDARGKRYPGLNMSRAMGDLGGNHDAGISAIPDVKSTAIAICKEPKKVAAANPGVKADSQPTEAIVTGVIPAGGEGRENTGTYLPELPGQPVAETQGEPDLDADVKSVRSTATSSHPSVSTHQLDPGQDKYLILCSDGVWEFVGSVEAVQIIGDIACTDAMAAAERLAEVSWTRWMKELDGQVVDDITAIIVNLSQSIDS